MKSSSKSTARLDRGFSDEEMRAALTEFLVIPQRARFHIAWFIALSEGYYEPVNGLTEKGRRLLDHDDA